MKLISGLLPLLIPKVLAEMAGTFAVIFVGSGSILLAERFPHSFPAIGVPLAWAFIIGLMITALGDISGAHFNPAVTLAFVAAKKFPLSYMPVYWGSQFLGGLLAVGLLAVIQKI